MSGFFNPGRAPGSYNATGNTAIYVSLNFLNVLSLKCLIAKLPHMSNFNYLLLHLCHCHHQWQWSPVPVSISQSFPPPPLSSFPDLSSSPHPHTPLTVTGSDSSTPTQDERIIIIKEGGTVICVHTLNPPSQTLTTWRFST